MKRFYILISLAEMVAQAEGEFGIARFGRLELVIEVITD